FLEECNIKSFRDNIGIYLTSLETIIKTENGRRREKAQQLYKHSLSFKSPSRAMKPGSRPDRTLARKWESEHAHKQVHFHQPTFLDYGSVHGSIHGTVNGTITGGSFIVGSKREYEEDDFVEPNQIKRTRSERQRTPEDQIRPSFFPLRVEQHATATLLNQINTIQELWARQQSQIKPQTVLVDVEESVLDDAEESVLEDNYYFIDKEEVKGYDFTEHEEMRNLNSENVSIRNTLLEILYQCRSKDLESGKTVMNSIFLNGIIDMTDAGVKQSVRSKLNKEQKSWLDRKLEKQAWDQTTVFKDYCSQFTEDKCDRVQIPTLVRKSYIVGYCLCEVNDSIMNSSERLEAPINPESNASSLERTYSIDTTIYIMNRLFRMHQDVLDWNWMEILTTVTKNRKIDGVLKVLKIKKENHRIIGIAEFSRGIKSPDTKDVDDKVKLGRNAMRILNKLLDTVPYGEIRIRYMVRPLPSIYLDNEFACIKLPNSFDDMDQFAMDMAILMNFQ
ncbi:12763_t:CDS:10, partial [Dentiscutata heterogama]